MLNAPLGYKKHPDIKGKLLVDDETNGLLKKSFPSLSRLRKCKNHKAVKSRKSSDSVMAKFYKIRYFCTYL